MSAHPNNTPEQKIAWASRKSYRRGDIEAFKTKVLQLSKQTGKSPDEIMQMLRQRRRRE